ncbi:LysM domain-containing protein [Streptomyces sp. NPDC088921]|uniref:LysM domain-containing protein n=1 Tax=unclassified Streptomyces TaxID=2593676 RepID=UPI0034182766
MFDQSSRYRDVPLATYADDQGSVRVWVTLRVPPAKGATIGYLARPQDRVDLLADRAYGDPGAWWHIADANPATVADGPHELTATPGARIELPQPVHGEVLP